MKRLTARLAKYAPPVLTANVAARVVALARSRSRPSWSRTRADPSCSAS